MDEIKPIDLTPSDSITKMDRINSQLKSAMENRIWIPEKYLGSKEGGNYYEFVKAIYNKTYSWPIEAIKKAALNYIAVRLQKNGLIDFKKFCYDFKKKPLSKRKLLRKGKWYGKEN